MEPPYDYQKCAILYVDDEEKSFKYFTRAFGDKFKILSAANASDGYRLLEQHRDEIALLITDQRMPGEKGVELLQRAQRLHPKAIRILTTAYSDFDVAIDAVNSGAISKYVTKPWDIPQLEMVLKQVCEFFTAQRERDLVLEVKSSEQQEVITTDRGAEIRGSTDAGPSSPLLTCQQVYYLSSGESEETPRLQSGQSMAL